MKEEEVVFMAVVYGKDGLVCKYFVGITFQGPGPDILTDELMDL